MHFRSVRKGTHNEKFMPSPRMSNILTYVRVAPANSDVQSILEIPVTDEIHMENTRTVGEEELN